MRFAVPLCCPSAAPPHSRRLLVPGGCCTCFRPSTVPGDAAELLSLLLLFNFGSAYRAAKVKFKEGFAVVPISSQVTLLLRPGSELPVPVLLPPGCSLTCAFSFFRANTGSVPNAPHHLLPAETLQLWGNAHKLFCCDAFLDLPKFSLAIFPWLQTVLILATIVQHRGEVKRGGCVKGLLVTFPKQQGRC